jgi:hypothetical protein
VPFMPESLEIEDLEIERKDPRDPKEESSSKKKHPKKNDHQSIIHQ